jgi:phospholipid/cholesterol/gamma-HCH transport system permease protein
MKVHGEIDALDSMGIDPVRFLVLPAVLGCTVGMVCLSLLFTASALLGGFVVAHVLALLFPGSLGLDMELPLYLEKISGALRFMDGAIMVLKPAIFGLSIALLACLNGLSLGISTHEVPQGTRSAVVQSFVSVVAMDGIFAAIFVIPQLMGVMP